MSPDASSPQPTMVRFLRRAAPCLRRPSLRVINGLGVIAQALTLHLTAPSEFRLAMALTVVGVPLVVLAVAGHPFSAEIAAHFTPRHPGTVEGIVRLAGFAAGFLVLPVLPGPQPVVFVVLAAVLLHLVVAAGNVFGVRDREMGWARDAAAELGMDGAAVERLWLRLSSQRARGARLHAVGLRRAARELAGEESGEVRVFPSAEWLRGRAAGRSITRKGDGFQERVEQSIE